MRRFCAKERERETERESRNADGYIMITGSTDHRYGNSPRMSPENF